MYSLPSAHEIHHGVHACADSTTENEAIAQSTQIYTTSNHPDVSNNTIAYDNEETLKYSQAVFRGVQPSVATYSANYSAVHAGSNSIATCKPLSRSPIQQYNVGYSGSGRDLPIQGSSRQPVLKDNGVDTIKSVQYFDKNPSIDGDVVKHDNTEFKLNRGRPTNHPAMQPDVHPYPLWISEENTEDVDRNHNTYVVTLLRLEVPARGMTAWGEDLAGAGMHFN